MMTSYGQDLLKSFSDINKESLEKIADTIVRKEIAAFTIKGTQLRSNTDSGVELTEVPLYTCTDTFMIFQKADLYSVHVMVHIRGKNRQGSPRIAEVIYMHEKFMLFLPASAYEDIVEPNFCKQEVITNGKQQRKAEVNSQCRVFRSKENGQVYIYMLNSSGANRYEVTWIIQQGAYYSRVIDRVPED